MGLGLLMLFLLLGIGMLGTFYLGVAQTRTKFEDNAIAAGYAKRTETGEFQWLEGDKDNE